MHDDPADHPLRIAARALAGALLTEVAVALAALAVVGAYGAVSWSYAGPGLAHAVGLGLGATVALSAADAALARGRRLLAAGLGLGLSPLAALGGWYGLHLADTLSVKEATVAVVAVLEEVVTDAELGSVSLLLGVALLGYAPPVLLRRRGRGAVEQAARTACLLVAGAAVSVALQPSLLDGWPLGGWVVLLLVRSLALPAGLALGDAVGARVVRGMRGEEAPARARGAPWSGRRARWSLGMLAALLVALWPFAMQDHEATSEVLLAGWRASGDDARFAAGKAMVDEGVREVIGRDLGRAARPGLQPAVGAFLRGSRPLPDARPLLVGQADVALSVAATEPLTVGLHTAAARCLEPVAARGDVDAMLLMAAVLHAGTRLRTDVGPMRGYRWHSYEASADERAAALAWARRAIEVGPGDRERRLGRRSSSTWGVDAAEPGAVVRSLARESVADAVVFARLLAARDPSRAAPLNDLLLEHRRLRTPGDDVFLATTLPWTTPVPAERVEGLAPEVPADVVASRSREADALARRALEAWCGDPGRARALALQALVRDDRHPQACLLVAAWHVRQALADHGAPGHLDVAEQHLMLVERRAPLDPALLVNGALCDALRAMLSPQGDRGWAVRALGRLHAVAALAPARERGRLPRVVRALADTGIGVRVQRGAALLRLADAHERAAGSAQHAGDMDEVRARTRAVETLRALAAARAEADATPR